MLPRMTDPSPLSPNLCGASGEYFVAAELSRLGYVASLTLRNAKGIDVLAASNDARRSVGIQVKTSQKRAKEWLLNQAADRFKPPGVFYVFVILGDAGTIPAFHVVPSRVVAEYVRTSHAAWLRTRRKDGRKHRDTPMRKFKDPKDKFLGRWDLLGL